MSNVSEKIESQTEKINGNLDSLQTKIDSFNNQGKLYSYERDQNGVYYAKVNGVALDVKFNNPKDLLQALKVISHMISTYTRNGYSWSLYAWEDMWTKWNLESIIDLKVDNRQFLFDTTFLRAETVEKVFGIIDTRNKMETQKIADFLNKVLWNQIKKEEI